MDQMKIGAFISQQRKAKGWTQSQLAEKLGITDKAISKWETGRSMPDLSLFVPLCSLLGVTLNELFAGERIAEGNLKEKADQVLMEVIASWLGQDKDKWKAKESGAALKNVLEVNHVSKLYETGGSPVLAVNQVSFQISPGSFVGIMGASGSGKTTLLNVIATIDKPTHGTVQISGQTITDMPEEITADFRRRHLGFVFQEYNLLETLTIYENIALALTIREVPKEKIRPMVLGVAEKLGLSSLLDQFPHEVSGGQRQRCACARAIVASPDLILADEPTGALDSHGAKQLLSTFGLLCKEYGATILMVTHDVMAASYCDRIFFMKNGEIKASLDREGKSKQAFFTDILKIIEWMEGESHDVLETVNP